MAIEWYNPNKALPTVTIALYGLNLSASAVEFFNNVSKVKLGVDSDKKKICIKAAEALDESAFKFSETGETSKTVRISCREYIQYVAIKLGISFEKSEKYFAYWDENESALMVDLNKKLLKNKRANKKK